MSKVVFVADFFIDEISGGAERCNESLIEYLQKDFKIEKIKSRFLTTETINENLSNFFIIANFFHLSVDIKEYLAKNARYVIYEHDHKYLSTNNPLPFKNFQAPERYIINKTFFKNAQNVLCQSTLHAQTVYKNLLIDNIVNVGGNAWSQNDISVIKKYIGSKKEVDYATMETDNSNKGMPQAIEYCKEKGLNLTLMPSTNYEGFISNLSKTKTLVFFPQWMESYSRVAVEARILGCKIMTNKLIGVSSEEYYKLKGKDLLQKVEENTEKTINLFKRLILNQKVDHNFIMKAIPKITISCSVYDGDSYIKSFLEDITKQTIFDQCELIIVNANSPGNEEKIILDYVKKYDNIFYHRLDYRATTTEVVNMVIDDLSTGELITIGNIDDRRRKDCLEIQAKNLMFDREIDLVYADCIQTKKENETFENNSSNGKLYEHSIEEFSKENMIKCLPGPMPMWRLSVHKELGVFDKNYNYVNDWEMWLRLVKAGKKFKKINDVLGLYYFNEKGRSTSIENFRDKIKEESKLFFENEDTFGEQNFKKYKNHFSQGL